MDTVRPTRSRQVTKNLSCVHYSVKRDEQGMFKYFFVRFRNETMYLLVLFYCALSLLHATLLRSLSSLLFSIIMIYSLLFSIPYFAFLISVSRQYLILWLPLRMCMLQHMSIYDYIRTYLTYLQRM